MCQSMPDLGGTFVPILERYLLSDHMCIDPLFPRGEVTGHSLSKINKND